MVVLLALPLASHCLLSNWLLSLQVGEHFPPQPRSRASTHLEVVQADVAEVREAGPKHYVCLTPDFVS